MLVTVAKELKVKPVPAQLHTLAVLLHVSLAWGFLAVTGFG